MNKPSQFVFIPTEKASEIFLHKGGDMCFNKTGVRDKNEFAIPQHIYILSDDEIKERDWYYHPINGATKWGTRIEDLASFCKKIIASTNPELNSRIDGGSFEEFQSKSYMPSISQSDIEYIIGVYNRRGKIDVEKLAFDYAYQYNDCEVQRMDDRQGGFEEGYNQCLQDNADKKFTFEDMRNLANSVAEFVSHNEPDEFDKWIEKKLERYSKVKEQPKSDTVIVEYKERVEEDTTKDYIVGKGQPCITWHEPKLKDGNIVIVR